MRRAKPRDVGALTFFIDECIKCSLIEDAINRGKQRSENLQVAKKGTLDPDWLREAGLAGWICFSRDRRMLSRPNELSAIIYYNVALFMVGEATGAEHAQLIADALKVVRRAATTLKRPFVVRIEPNADLTVLLERGKWLAPARRMRRLKSER